MPTILDSALAYQEKGFSVIPVGKDKRPLIKWEPYQKRRAIKEEILGWFKKWPDMNIGIVTGEISDLLVIDTDKPAASKAIQEAIPETMVVPCQQTPRGGLHFFFKHEKGFTNRSRVADGVDIRTTGGYVVVSPSVNGNGRGYCWLPELSILNSPQGEIPLSIISFINNNKRSFYIYSNSESSRQENSQVSSLSSPVAISFSKGSRNDDLFHVSLTLFKGGMSDAEVLQTIELLAQKCDPPWGSMPEDGPVDKIVRSASERIKKKERNLTDEVRDWILSSFGVFLSSEVRNCLHLSSREEEKNLSKILFRFSNPPEKLIERYGNKRGQFRIIEKQIEKMDWMAEEESILRIDWPLGLQELFITYPKNVIAISGTPDGGKTCFCLEFCKKNMGKMKINYFTSEMGSRELKSRAKNFGIPFEDWKKVDFYERSNNFEDVIDPNAVNIIDYILVPEEPWKVGIPIRNIFQKLNKGIAIICLQRPFNRDVAKGGEVTLEVPRLYLSIGKGIAKIIKCKNWAKEDRNPNNLTCNYETPRGAKMLKMSDWAYPYDNF